MPRCCASASRGWRALSSRCDRARAPRRVTDEANGADAAVATAASFAPEVPDVAHAADRRLHVATVLLDWGGSLTRSVLPLGFLYLQNRDFVGRWLPLAGAVLLVLTAAWSIADFVLTRYGLTDEAFVMRSGVLRRQLRVIPVGRIQSVNVRQSLAQRLLRVAELRVETATQGGDAEAVLRVLTRAEADRLREQLLAARRGDSARGAQAGVPGTADADAVPGEVIAALDTEELMVGGGTSNNVGVLLALLFSACQRLSDTFLEESRIAAFISGPLGMLREVGGNVWWLLLVFLVAVVPVLVVAWLVSVLGAVVRYHGFTLERVGGDLRRRYGWLSRTETSVPIARAQAVRFRQSLLRRPFHRGDLLLVAAGSVSKEAADTGGVQHLLPIVRTAQVAAVVSAVFPEAECDGVFVDRVRSVPDDWRRAPRRAWLRQALVLTWWIGIACLALVGWRGPAWWALLWLLPPAWGLAGVRWRVRAMRELGGHLAVREGGLSRTTVLMPERKLQLVQLSQGPLQRLFGLASLEFTTAGAGGAARMVDLPLAEARSVQEDLMHRLPRARRRATVPASAPRVQADDADNAGPSTEWSSHGA